MVVRLMRRRRRGLWLLNLGMLRTLVMGLLWGGMGYRLLLLRWRKFLRLLLLRLLRRLSGA